MKTHLKNLFLVPALIAVLDLIPAGPVTAQTFTTLHNFTTFANPINNTNSDGANPFAGLITSISGDRLYGTASAGGSSGDGTVFAINSDGTGFTNLHHFAGSPSDGRSPDGGLLLSGSTLYGTTDYGGSSGNGVVFAINSDGTGFTNLHSFTYSDGSYPHPGLTASGNILYGTTIQGGSSGDGTLFAIHTDGTGFTNFYNFTHGSDGGYPYAGVILTNNTLYGTASQSSPGGGAIFAIRTDGTGFTNLHSFAASNDGGNPVATLILSGSRLYGTTQYGGGSGNGTIFALNTDGSGFTNLHSFTGVDQTYYTNNDGANPVGGLVVLGNTLYGAAQYGGSSGAGTVFALSSDGTGFTNLYNFTSIYWNPSLQIVTNSDGAYPRAGLVLWGNTLFGTASYGGTFGNGTIFSLSFRPQLTITPSGTNVILSWPTNVAGFDYTGYSLQSTTNLLSPAAWVTNSPAPVVVNGLNTVTNPISGLQQFYRLIQ